MNQKKKFDIALSFAGENREYVERVAILLQQLGISVFYDSFEEPNLWGKNLYDYLSDIYQNQAKYTIVFISESYNEKLWTNHERQSMQSRALEENREYILPVRFDNTTVPGILNTTGYIDLRNKKPEELVEIIKKKLGFVHRYNKLLLYVSHGGTCRDPMAVIITQILMREKRVNMNLIVKGQALYKHDLTVSNGARHAIKQIYGADFFLNYTPEQISEEICNEADLILVMSKENLSTLLKRFPSVKNKSYVFKEFFGSEGDINDPFLMDNETYIKCANEMKEIITERFDCLINALNN